MKVAPIAFDAIVFRSAKRVCAAGLTAIAAAILLFALVAANRVGVLVNAAGWGVTTAREVALVDSAAALLGDLPGAVGGRVGQQAEDVSTKLVALSNGRFPADLSDATRALQNRVSNFARRLAEAGAAADPGNDEALRTEAVELAGLLTAARQSALDRRDRVATQLLTGIPVSGFLLLALIGLEGAFLFRPALRRLEKAHRDLLDVARHDPLTGCVNRRYLTEMGAREFSRFVRYGTALAILFVDIDHFKKVNDSYGHSLGDEALKTLVQVVVKNIRPSDFLGRLGGEEFAILLHVDTLTTACQVAEKLRELIAAATIRQGGKTTAITASFGATMVLPSDRTFFDALDRADRALYIAKETGRNRVATAEETPAAA